MAFLTAMSNSFGARWFDEKWKPQFDSRSGRTTLDFYVDLMKADGPAGRFRQRLHREPDAVPAGQVRHVDRRHGRRLVRDRSEGRRRSPTRSASRSRPTTASASAATGCGRGRWRIPAGSKKVDAAEKFIAWATSKHYTELVASKDGWANVPPGTRTSLYTNPDYQKAAPFAAKTLDSINAADPTHPTVKPVPYTGVQFVAIPEFQGIATKVGQIFSAALAGR